MNQITDINPVPVEQGEQQIPTPVLRLDHRLFEAMQVSWPGSSLAELVAAAGTQAQLELLVSGETTRLDAAIGVLAQRRRGQEMTAYRRWHRMGPVVVAIDAEDWRDPAFQRALWRSTNPFFPVELAPYWQVADRGVRRSATGADAGGEIDWSETCALTAGEVVERLHVESREALRAAHEAAWGRGRPGLMAPGCVHNTVFLTSHEVLRNWARGGLTALFAHPFFPSMQPGDRWRLAQDVQPKLLIHDMQDPADLELIADFADETVMLSRGGV